MLATFYLTGPFSASTLSTVFTIVGQPGAITHIDVTKAQLLSGHTISFVDSVTGGTVTATNETCAGTQKPWLVIQSTPTPSPTPTETIVSFAYDIEPSGESTVSSSCQIFAGSLPTVVYASSQFTSSVTRFFTDPALSIGFGGSGDFHSYKRDVESSSSIKSARVSPSGFTSEISDCPV